MPTLPAPRRTWSTTTRSAPPSTSRSTRSPSASTSSSGCAAAFPRSIAAARLEVACGTGYWTQFIARTAAKVHACDINDSVLEIAREKPLPKGRVSFFKADAVSLEGVPAGCDAAFAASGGRM